MEDGRTDAQADGLRECGHRGMAQDQNGGIQPRLPQLQRLQHGGNAEKAALILQQPGDLNGAVAVGVGFDDGHDLDADFFMDGGNVGGNGIQIYLYIGVVVIQ